MTENLSTGLLSNFITAAFGENLRFTISFLFAFAFLMLLFLRVSEKQRRKHARETLQEAVEANDGFRGFEVTVQETDTNEDHYFLRGTVSSVSFPNAKAPELHLSEVYRFEVTSLSCSIYLEDTQIVDRRCWLSLRGLSRVEVSPGRTVIRLESKQLELTVPKKFFEVQPKWYRFPHRDALPPR